MIPTPRVLIVDESEESRQVLSELLHRWGAETVQLPQADAAAEYARQHRPDLIVYDAESDHSDTCEATRRLADTAQGNDTPVIVLGSVTRSGKDIPAGQFVAKPYHYGPLIRRIEDLLAAG